MTRTQGLAERSTDATGPELGLVCLTHSPECRYRTLTRTRYLSLSPARRRDALERLYWDNLGRLHGALSFCRRRGIRLYRVTSGLFPLSDQGAGRDVLAGMAALLSSVGRRAERLGIRVLMHPDQFVVVNSERAAVRHASAAILEKHGLAFDLLGLPRSPWAAIIIHGGKSGRSDELVDAIRRLPPSVWQRLALENDESAYGSAEILDVCRRAGVPMVFDAHHHVIKERLETYEHPSVADMTRAAGGTWPDPSWQIVHLSNGRDAFADRRHSDLIARVPSAYAAVPWIEVEARGKELAIEQLRAEWPLAH
jgi:UV DNA damage endonuclease